MPNKIKKGELCLICGKRYLTVWRCPDKIWKKVFKSSSSGLICPECFDRRAREKGINLYWECIESKFPTQAKKK